MYSSTHCQLMRGLNSSAVSRALADEGLAYSRKAVATLVRKFRSHTATRKPGSGRPTKITQQVKDLVENRCKKTTRLQLPNSSGIFKQTESSSHDPPFYMYAVAGTAYCQYYKYKALAL